MNIYHICCTSSSPTNGMVNVIPKHVVNQGKYANTILINLAQYKYPIDSNCSYNKKTFQLIGFKKLIEKHGKPDLFVFHGIYLPEIWKFWIKYVKGKYPYVIVPHGSMTIKTQQKNPKKKKLFNHLIVYSFCRGAVGVQMLSQGELESSENRFNKNFFVQPNGVELQSIGHKGNTAGHLDLLYIGRLDIYHKGLDLLLNATIKEREFLESNNITIHIYGPFSEPDYPKIKNIIDENSLEKVVELNDAIFNADKFRQYEENNIFIQTSRSEGLPMGLLEAMSYGMPLLITEGTNLAEDVKSYNNGFVEETSVDGVRKLFHEAKESEDRITELSRNSLECVKKYGWNKVAKETVEKYKRLLEKSVC